MPRLAQTGVKRKSTAGIRAQALDRSGRMADDFVVSQEEGIAHVRNAPSPAATSSLAIARWLVDRLESTDADRVPGANEKT